LPNAFTSVKDRDAVFFSRDFGLTTTEPPQVPCSFAEAGTEEEA